MQAMEVEGEDAFRFESHISTAKYVECVAGLEKVVALTKKYHIKTAWGTDMLFDPPLAAKQGKFLAKMKKWYTPYEVLKMATSGNAELVKMCGPRDPYPGGEGRDRRVCGYKGDREGKEEYNDRNYEPAGTGHRHMPELGDCITSKYSWQTVTQLPGTSFAARSVLTRSIS
jgi:hypothetical protein